jgi:cold shock protein
MSISTGTIKMYDEERGFGFIRSDDHAADVFVHAKSIVGASELIQGQIVEFEAVFDSARGKYRAADVRVV